MGGWRSSAKCCRTKNHKKCGKNKKKKRTSNNNTVFKKSDKNYNDTGKWEINVFRNNKKKV